MEKKKKETSGQNNDKECVCVVVGVCVGVCVVVVVELLNCHFIVNFFALN